MIRRTTLAYVLAMAVAAGSIASCTFDLSNDEQKSTSATAKKAEKPLVYDTTAFKHLDSLVDQAATERRAAHHEYTMQVAGANERLQTVLSEPEIIALLRKYKVPKVELANFLGHQGMSTAGYGIALNDKLTSKEMRDELVKQIGIYKALQ